MSYDNKFRGWDNLKLEDLLVAYRKAKADCFYESVFPTSVKFAEFEQDLLGNIKTLHIKLINNKGFSLDSDLVGKCHLIPKKLEIKPKDSSSNGHAHFSDSKRAFDDICKNNNLTPEFRVVGDFPVESHIISALWINMIGHKFDNCLNETAYGSRLRRLRNDSELDKEIPKDFHLSAIGSFEPYFQPYRKWRKDGLDAIRFELDQERKVIAVSLDLKTYYHLIDPDFLAASAFQREVGLSKKLGNKLSNEERGFTQQLTELLSGWTNRATEFANTLQDGSNVAVNGGLVIGLSVSRIIANVLLKKWDDLIQTKLTPVHYGRYVDDMFLVFHDPGTISDSESLMRYLQDRLGDTTFKPVKSNEDCWEIDLGEKYQKKSKIVLQSNKQRLFLLEGQAGCDLLDSIEKDICELSSEFRLMPAPDQLEHTTAAKVLTAAGDVGEQADTLRRADSLTMRRLSWSLQLRHVEILSHDLPASEWRNERNDFYEFAKNHVLRADKIFAHYQYLPRLLGFAIGQKEWRQAGEIVERTLQSFDDLKKNLAKSGQSVLINGSSCTATAAIWKHVVGSVTWWLIDSAAKNYPADIFNNTKPDKGVQKLADVFFKQLWGKLTPFDFLDVDITSNDFFNKAPLLAASDLSQKPYKYILREQPKNFILNSDKKYNEDEVLSIFTDSGLIDIDDLKLFINKSKKIRLKGKINKNKGEYESIIPYLFPTRPYTPSEISELIPQCVSLGNSLEYSANELWARLVRSVRGVWVNPSLLSSDTKESIAEADSDDNYKNIVKLSSKSSKKVIIGITNFKTEDKSWELSACGKNDYSIERYIRLSGLVNQVLKLKPRPEYLLLPELSLPLKWVDSISNRLLSSGISLIAGTEYRHVAKNGVYSEAVLSMTDDRLGYPASVRIYQPKAMPAVDEEEELISTFGKVWAAPDNPKPVYVHNGFHFGVMVCSEVLNSKERIAFQGEVDALMVLAWNKDLETFSALIDSTALDVHAYTILVNNRQYGDSRVRSPSKESFLRDIARLRGGENDYCVVVELEIEKLRAFQSRFKRWTKNGDLFKPVPEGFKISKERKVLPPK